MSITRTNYPERVLIVLNPDGTLKGAHQEAIEAIRDGDDVISVRQMPAAPLDAATLAAVLPDHAALAAQVQALTDQIATLTTDRDAAVDARDAALARVTDLEAQIAAASADAVDANGFPVLTAVQVRIALRQAGITAAMVDAVIAAIPDEVQRDVATAYWEYATQLHRNHPLIAHVAAALGLTDDQVDAMWRAAAAIG